MESLYAYTIFSHLRCPEKGNRKSIVLVVSLLMALKKDQIGKIKKMRINATLVSNKESTTSTKQGIQREVYQIVFVSPEAIFIATVWRSMMSSSVYHLNLLWFIVEECH